MSNFTDTYEFSSFKKWLLIIFCLFVGFNHLIKILNAGGVPLKENIEGWSLTSSSPIVNSLDNFRAGMGESVGSIVRHCPQQYSIQCQKVMSGVRIILGLY